MLEQREQIIPCHLHVSEDLQKNPRPEDFLSVNRNCGFPPVRMFDPVMATFNSHDLESHLAKCFDQLGTGYTREFAHNGSIV